MLVFLDCETTTWNKGNPFDSRNWLVCVGWITEEGVRGIWYSDQPRGPLAAVLSAASRIIAFNAKFDLHWLRKAGFIDVGGRPIFCVQVAEFFLGRQGPAYPSLDGTAAAYGIPGKFDRVKAEYWDRGINTHEIPRSILSEYCLQDIEVTKQLYYLQQAKLEQSTVQRRKLLSLQMQDLWVLEDVEFNGLVFNPEVVEKRQKELETEISKLQEKLDIYHNVPSFNWSSPAHLSALLFGGTIVEERRIPVGVFKTGKKVGQPRFAVERVTHTLPRMYKPPKGSETQKEGVWSTDEDTLLKIKGGKKELIESLLKIRELNKLQSTYVGGLLDKHRAMHWPDRVIHGQYNQVVTGTGRLSSSNPNMQNMAGDIQDMFVTRFND